MNTGTRYGIRTIEDLKGRCRIDELTGCWEWGGGRDAHKRACLWLPELGRQGSLGMAACLLRTGKAPTKGVNWFVACRTKDCANPMHRKPGSRSEQMRAANITRNPLERGKIARGRRANSKLSDEMAAAIRASSDSLRILSKRYGVSISHCSNIKRGKQRRELSAPGSSAFSWCP